MLNDDEDHLDDTDDEHPSAHAEPRPIDKFRHTAVGSVLAAGMLGLREIFDPPKDEEVAIVHDWAGEPFDDNILMRLDPEHPEDSIVVVRRPAPKPED